MSKASSVSFTFTLVAALALCATNAFAMSIFEKGGAQDVKNVSDGYVNVNGNINDNGTETYDIAALSHRSSFVAGSLPFELSTIGQSENSDFGRSDSDFAQSENSDDSERELSPPGSNSFATGSLASAIARFGGSNGMGGVSNAARVSASADGPADHPTIAPGGNNNSQGNNSQGNNNQGNNNQSTAADPAADPVVAPLPAALPLFATGLGALGLLGWRRKRKAESVA